MGNIHITWVTFSAGWAAAHLDKLHSDLAQGPCFSHYLLRWLSPVTVEMCGNRSHKKENMCQLFLCFHPGWIPVRKGIFISPYPHPIKAPLPSTSLPVDTQLIVNTFRTGLLAASCWFLHVLAYFRKHTLVFRRSSVSSRRQSLGFGVKRT